MSNKKIGVYSAIIWLIIIPITIFAAFLLGTYPTYQLSADPTIKLPSYETPEDVYFLLNIRLGNTSENEIESLSAKWEVVYNILVDSSREPARVSLAETLPGWSGFSASLGDYPSENTTYYIRKNGNLTWADYRTWKYSYTSVLTLQWNSIWFPIDKFESPVIYVWTNSEIYPFIKLESQRISGFVFTLRPIGLTDPAKAYDSFTVAQKMGQGLPNTKPFGFQIIVQRDANFILLYSLYFSFVFFLIYYIAALSRLVNTNFERKIQLFATLSISVIAFIWTLRQVAGDVSYIELILMLEIFAWILIEIILNVKRSSGVKKPVYVY